MKNKKHIFASVKQDLRWGRVIDFKTREVVAESTTKESAQMRVQTSQKPTTMASERGFFRKAMNQNSYQNIILAISMFILAALVFYSTSAMASGREPQGDFSALVEQDKTREDFKTEEELKQYIKEQDEKLQISQEEEE